MSTTPVVIVSGTKLLARYRDAYKVSRGLITLGNIQKIVVIIFGLLLALVGLGLMAMSPLYAVPVLIVGVGLGATKERLMRMYDRQSLEIHPLPEGGTEVRIVLPAHGSVRVSDAPDEIKQHLSDRTAVHHA